jgi:PAS domain S-box-containing protein
MTDQTNLDRLAEMTGKEATDAKLREEISAAVIELSPDGIVIVDQDGFIFMVNGAAELLFGYARKELFGKNIEILIPERLRGSHVSHRTTYMEEPRPRTMGVNLQIVAKRRDNSELPVEISLSPLPTERGLFTIAIIRRKRAG